MVGDIFDWGNDQQTTCFMKKDPTWEEISVQAMQMSECLDVAEPGRKMPGAKGDDLGVAIIHPGSRTCFCGKNR